MTHQPCPEPPVDPPPVLFTRVFSRHGPPADNRTVNERGQVLLRSASAATPAAQPFDEHTLRDVVLDAALELVTGPPDSTFGIYLRQSTPQHYVLWTLTPQRRFRVGLVDGGYQPVHDGLLGPDIPLRATGPNRFTVLACGPCLTFVLNDRVVTGAMVDQRWAQGAAGAWVQAGELAAEPPTAPLADHPGATLRLHWVQARAVLAPLPATPPPVAESATADDGGTHPG